MRIMSRFRSSAFVPCHLPIQTGLGRARSTCRTVMKQKTIPLSKSTALILAASSGVLGPLLDNYHSRFHILRYNEPLELSLNVQGHQLFSFTTAPFTSPLFVVAGLMISIGTLAINRYFAEKHTSSAESISMPRALATVAAFSAIYYLSAVLPCTDFRYATGPLLTALAALEWYMLDGSMGGLIMGILTAIGGPCVEMGLINWAGLYTYSSPEWCGIPLFISAVYFAGGPAVGNLARGVQGGMRQGEDAGRGVTG